MPISDPQINPPAPEGYAAVFLSTLPDSAGGGGPFSIRVTADWAVMFATEAEYDALFQSVIDTLEASPGFVFQHAEKRGDTTWQITPTP